MKYDDIQNKSNPMLSEEKEIETDQYLCHHKA